METTDIPQKNHSENNVKVDLGASTLATLSTGETITGPKPHKKLLRRLRTLSKALSRKAKGSKNRAKAKIKLARVHARIYTIRMDAIHKFTTDLVRRFSTIYINEKLDLSSLWQQS